MPRAATVAVPLGSAHLCDGHCHRQDGHEEPELLAVLDVGVVDQQPDERRQEDAARALEAPGVPATPTWNAQHSDAASA